MLYDNNNTIFSAPEAHDLEWKRALSSSRSRATADWAAAILLSIMSRGIAAAAAGL